MGNNKERNIHKRRLNNKKGIWEENFYNFLFYF